MNATQALWIISMMLEATVFVRGLQTAWRSVYPTFFGYLALDLLASLVLLAVSIFAPHGYDVPWRVVSIGKAVGMCALVVEAYRALAKEHPWHFPIPLIVTMAATGSALLHLFVSHAYHWPWSSLEGVFGLLGLSSAMLFCVMAGLLMQSGLPDGKAKWHARVLAAYLFLVTPCYYAASEHIHSIGLALMIVAAVCYSAWLAVFGGQCCKV